MGHGATEWCVIQSLQVAHPRGIVPVMRQWLACHRMQHTCTVFAVLAIPLVSSTNKQLF